jgi:hypothetical protein
MAGKNVLILKAQIPVCAFFRLRGLSAMGIRGLAAFCFFPYTGQDNSTEILK